jgi:hypothetical protein
MKILSAFLVASFLMSTSCLAQEIEPISTDRPRIGSGPELVPVRSLVTENGIGWTNDDHLSRFDLPETFFRYGVSDRIETRLLMPNAHISGGDPTQTDDIQLGVKVRLLPEGARWPIALTTTLSAPTGSGLSSGGWDPYETFSITHPLPERYSSSASLVLASVSGDPQGRRLFAQAGFDFGYEVMPHRSVFVEYAPLYDGRQQSGGYTVDGGALWVVRPNIQLDFHVGRTVVADHSGITLGVGYSLRRFLSHTSIDAQ